MVPQTVEENFTRVQDIVSSPHLKLDGVLALALHQLGCHYFYGSAVSQAFLAQARAQSATHAHTHTQHNHTRIHVRARVCFTLPMPFYPNNSITTVAAATAASTRYHCASPLALRLPKTSNGP